MIRRVYLFLIVWLCAGCAANDSTSKQPYINQQDGLYGYVDADGNEVIPCKYPVLEELDSAFLVYGNANKRYGVIAKNGVILTPPKYIDIDPFIGKRACVSNEEGDFVMDRSGREVAYARFIRRLSENRFAYRLNSPGNFGLMDENGNKLTSEKFNNLEDFHEGLAGAQILTSRNGMRWGFIDEQGTLKIPYRYESVGYFSEGLAAVKIETGGLWGGLQWGFIDTKGKMVIPPQYTYVYPFSEGLAAVPDDHTPGRLGYIDKTGKVVIPHQFDIAESFVGGYAIVGEHNNSIYIPDRFGAINRKGELVVSMEYTDQEAVLRVLNAMQ